MTKKKIVIIGAGLAGLSAAWHLQKRGIDCQVFEKESEVGGLCRSKHIKGFIFDHDGHLLHFKNSYVFSLIKSLLGKNLAAHKRQALIYSFDRYTRYPFQANLYGLPPEVNSECLAGARAAHKFGCHQRKENYNFLEWINHTFGKGIAKHFMVPYNFKFWTVHPKELTCDWLRNFIPVPSLKQVIDGAVALDKREVGYNTCFWYPKKGGINQLPLALAKQIKNIHINCSVKEIDLNKKIIRTDSGKTYEYDVLINTAALPEIPRLIKDIPREIQGSFKKLKWNSIFNLNLGVRKKDPLKRHWVYFPTNNLCFFRIGFPHNFSSNLVKRDQSSLYAEVSYSKLRPIDKSKILLRIESDLKKVGIISQGDKVLLRDVNDIKYGYPIYDHMYLQARGKITSFLKENKIIACGRYGAWQYMSMEDAILDGKRVAEEIKL